MGAYHNALREEGSRKDLLVALEEAWVEIEKLRGCDSVVPSMAADVERFQREVLGSKIPSRPEFLSGDAWAFKLRHLNEEYIEYTSASNLEDQVDGLLDIVYVALGALIQMGVCPGAAFSEVHAANMRRSVGRNPTRPDAGVTDAVKPADWRGPDLASMLSITRDDVQYLMDVKRTDEYDGEDCDCGAEHMQPECVPKLPRLLVIGHAQHGKDTVCELLRDLYGFKFISSSLFCAEKIVYPALAGKYGYEAPEFCFEDRDNHRAEWYQLIGDFNRPDPTALARAILEENDVYCGLRSSRELHACRNTDVFDYIIWADASQRVKPEDRSSCTVEPWMADFVLDCNGSIDEAKFNLMQLMATLLIKEL